jgi:hypothetical protein
MTDLPIPFSLEEGLAAKRVITVTGIVVGKLSVVDLPEPLLYGSVKGCMYTWDLLGKNCKTIFKEKMGQDYDLLISLDTPKYYIALYRDREGCVRNHLFTESQKHCVPKDKDNIYKIIEVEFDG